MQNRADSGLKYVNTPPPLDRSQLDECFDDEIVSVNLIFCPYDDLGYGRPVEPEHVKNLTRGKAFDIAKTRIALALMPDGRYACIDGNHTVERARKEGLTHVRARVYIDKTTQEQAELFTAFDTQRRITAVRHFFNRIAAREDIALRIQRICKDHGVEIAVRAHDGATSAVAALEWIHNTYGSTFFADVLALIRSSYGLDGCINAKGLKAPALKGTAMFLRRYKVHADRDRLVRLMSDCGARRMFLNATQHHGTHPSDTMDVAYGLQIKELYDRGLSQKNRLPEWKSKAYSDETLAGMRGRGIRAAQTRRDKGEDISATVKRSYVNRKAAQ